MVVLEYKLSSTLDSFKGINLSSRKHRFLIKRTFLLDKKKHLGNEIEVRSFSSSDGYSTSLFLAHDKVRQKDK